MVENQCGSGHQMAVELPESMAGIIFHSRSALSLGQQCLVPSENRSDSSNI